MGLIGGVLGVVAATGLLATLVPLNMLFCETLFCVLPVVIQQTTVQDSQTDRLTNQPTNNNSHYDFIIVGAGSAGAVVANRLINSPSNYRVLVLEEGGEQQWPTYIPGLDVLDTGYNNFDYAYKSTPQVNSCQACKDKKLNYPRGKSLGGTSTLNFMMYLRGSPRDFDKWAEYAGDDSWNSTYAELLYQTHEHYTGLYPQNGAHGCGGELNIDQLRFKHLSVDTYQAAVSEQQSKGNLFLRDVNQNQNNSYMVIESTTSNGFRWSTNTAFLSGIPRKTDRFTVQKFSGVTKVLFSETNPTQVVGVEYAWHPDTAFVGGVKVEPMMFRAFADKEVILSAGAINSPQILLHSGIGPKDQLDALGIPVKKDLPVGKNFQDHVTIPLFVQLKKAGISFLPERDLVVDALGSLPRNPIGWLGGTTVHGTGFYSTPLNDDPSHPDIQNIFSYVGMTKIMDLALGGILSLETKEYKDIQKITNGQNDGHVVFTCVGRPWSAGSVTLNATAFQSTPEPYRYFQKPLIDPNYFSEQHDVDVAVAGIQNVLQFFNTSSQYKDIYNFIGGINYCNDIKAPKDSYEYLKCYIKHYTINLWHFSGTCKMGKQGDPTAVVDSRLRVQGIQNLRVIDASIMPNVTNANTNAPSILIGEKGARMIIEDHQGIQYPEKLGKRRECTPTDQPLVLPVVDQSTLAEMPNLLSIVQNAANAALKTNFDLVDTANFDTSAGNERQIPLNVCLKNNLQAVLNIL